MFQSGQVSKGPLFNNPQTVDIPHWTAGTELSKNNNKKSVITIVVSCFWQTDRGSHEFISRFGSQGLNTLFCNWQTNPVQLKWNAEHIAAVQMNNCFHHLWIWCVMEKVSVAYICTRLWSERKACLCICVMQSLWEISLWHKEMAPHQSTD